MLIYLRRSRLSERFSAIFLLTLLIIESSGRDSSRTNRIYHRSRVQTENSQPEGKRIMPETRFTEFPALSVDPRIGISRSTSETNAGLFSYIFSEKSKY